MPHFASWLAFALVALGMVLTPGPNMIYLISRSICQGRTAGLISLAGVALGFVVYMVCAAVGVTALLLAVPYAYDALRLAGALYLLSLAWQALKPGGRSLFHVRDLPRDGARKLFAMGLLTSLLNPKVAVLYLSLLPQFIDPGQGGVQPIARLGLHPNRHQPHHERDLCDHGGLDRGLPRRSPGLDDDPALADGDRAGGAGGADGHRGAAVGRGRPRPRLEAGNSAMRPSELASRPAMT